MFGNKLINTNAGGGCTNTVDLYNPFPDGGGVALYQLNGDATDESGNYDGTWGGTASYGTGVFGQAAVLNGSNNYINLGNGVSTLGGLFGAKNSFTVSLWFKTGTTTMSDLFSDFATNSFNCIIEMASNGTIDIVSRYSGTTYVISSTNSYNDNSWHNVVVTFDSGTNNLNFYVDNIFIASQNTPNAWNGTTNQRVTIGANYYTNSSVYQNYLNGSIDQVRIFNRALRPYEVAALYTEEYCTPTIVPSEHFNTVLYTGNGGTQSITGVGFQPDFVWIKQRTLTESHSLFDTVRGVDLFLRSDTTAAENNFGGTYGVNSFDSNGFTVGNGSAVNGNGYSMVGWNWKAGGATVSNTDGTITSQVSANTEAGFSVVSYTANGTDGASVGHGLDSAPKMIIYKGRNAVGDWIVLTTAIDGSADYLFLNTTAAKGDYPSNYIPTDNLFYSISSSSTLQFIAYCFAEVEGFSNFGSYVGTGASGNTIVTGFEPAFLLVRRTDSGDNWLVFDNKRSPSSPVNLALFPNSSAAEEIGNLGNGFTFLENGFNVISTDSGVNANGGSYIYMAFAADPTTIEPSLEDSFNTVLFTSTGGSQSVTGLGFQPDLLWTKNRTATWFHQIVDSVRGLPKTLYSNSTSAETTPVSYSQSLDTDGFTVNYTETIGSNYVAWAWKGAELPAINSNGSIPSVVSANPAAGFSIVSTKSNGSGYLNFGHGLDSAPKLVITKFTSQVGEWYTYTSAIANGFDVALKLNGTDAAITAYGADKWSSTDSVVGVGNSQWYFTANVPFIAYCFAEVAGFSKFGSYSGTDASGNYVATGFEPAFVMIKRSGGGAGNWVMKDNKRNPTNPVTNNLYANLNNAANDVTTLSVDFNPLGFTVNGTSGDVNDAGTNNYIYMAFANQF